MVFITFTIIFSTINHLLFKAFARFKIDLLTAVVFNYFVCVIIGYITSAEILFRGSIFKQNWYIFSIIQGALFAVTFYLMGRTTKIHGVAVTSLATRLAVAVPVFAAFFLYNDIISATKITGLLTALVALYLSCAGHENTPLLSTKKAYLPLFLFISFGMHSTFIKFVQEHFLVTTSYSAYIMSSFLAAFILSGSILLLRVITKKCTCQWRNVAAGIVLGFINYGAVYFLIRALSVPEWESSQLFPTISIAVVISSSFGAWLFFKEHINRKMLLSLVIGVGAIVLVNM